MKEFATDKQALDFIADRIAAEARREGTPLSEVERKMLYFSDTDWTLPDMAEVSADFDRDYDQDEYEGKIAGLIGKIAAGFKESDPAGQEGWDAAIGKLSGGDRYLLVMVDMARSAGPNHAGGGFLPTFDQPTVRPPHDRLKLWLTALAIAFGLIGVFLLADWLRGTRFAPIADWVLDRDKRGIVFAVAVFGWLFMRFVWPDLKSAIRVWLDGKQVPR